MISFGYVWRPKYNISKEVKKTSYSFDLCAPLHIDILNSNVMLVKWLNFNSLDLVAKLSQTNRNSLECIFIAAHCNIIRIL